MQNRMGRKPVPCINLKNSQRTNNDTEVQLTEKALSEYRILSTAKHIIIQKCWIEDVYMTAFSKNIEIRIIIKELIINWIIILLVFDLAVNLMCRNYLQCCVKIWQMGKK